jgi:methylated-DNA-protein-cysteine methyltransferase-like protein
MRYPPDRKTYYAQVYEIVRAIPKGKVMTYGSIGALIPPPEGVEGMKYRRLRPRWVGSAMAACDTNVPWHRVINAQGRISQRPGHGPKIQRQLLEEEGVIFNANDRVDLKVFSWEPTSDWLVSKNLLPTQM